MTSIPRLYIVNTRKSFIRLRMPFGEVIRRSGQSPRTLKKLGITSKGIEVERLKASLAGRKGPLRNFPLRTSIYGRNIYDRDTPGRQRRVRLDSLDFRSNTLEALLGRFGKDCLIPRFGAYQELADSLLVAFTRGDAVNLATLISRWPPHEQIRPTPFDGEAIYFFDTLDFTGLSPGPIDYCSDLSLPAHLKTLDTRRSIEFFCYELRHFTAKKLLAGNPVPLIIALLFVSGNLYAAASEMSAVTLPDISEGDISLLHELARKLPSTNDGRAMAKFRALFGLGLIQEAIDQVKELDRPLEATSKQIQIGMHNYYQQYLKDLAEIYHLELGCRRKRSVKDYALAVISLAAQYEVALAVARGGLTHAALVEISGTPLYIIDAHGHNGHNRVRWMSKINKNEFSGKSVLILEDDIVHGNTLQLVCNEIAKQQPARVEVLFSNPKGFSTLSAPVLNRFDKVMFLEDYSEFVSRDKEVELVQLFMRRQKAYLEERSNGQRLGNLVRSLRKRIKETLKELRPHLNKAEYKNLRSELYRKVRTAISAPLEQPGGAGKAVEQLRDIEFILGELDSR